MKPVTAYRTADGALHPDARTARAHARKRYDDAMTKLRHALHARGLSLSDAVRALSVFEDDPAPWLESVALREDITERPADE